MYMVTWVYMINSTQFIFEKNYQCDQGDEFVNVTEDAVSTDLSSTVDLLTEE